ncbi:unnamed protein product [Acanthoscelides obtectus]|uniref:Uncharacterized protein n=1 Tax=Acanthoscelides obtectus TaxID=200917 RepID=A0A9P0MLU9_ACAOB|nr:unnamed protein product [Acanthoscelides obtectus]CAK1630361.1 hypothetical protein AOBTE_LOCUS6283 [Acanthoscelides obtectus]
MVSNRKLIFLVMLIIISTVLVKCQNNGENKRGSGIRKATNLSLTDDLVNNLINFLMDLMGYASIAMDFVGQLPVVGRRRRNIDEPQSVAASN